jgi:CBS domain-containing protein
VDRICKRQGAILTIASDAAILDAAVKMQHSQVGCLLALNGSGTLVGIITERDIINKVVADRADPAATRVERVMSRNIVTCSPGTATDEAQRIMAIHQIRHLPIVQNGVPVGMVSSRDLLAAQLSAVKAVVQKQARILRQLEVEYPGITRLDKDSAGRVVI